MTRKLPATRHAPQGAEEAAAPWLRPLLARAFTARGTLWLCGREAAAAPGFRLVLSTGLGAPATCMIDDTHNPGPGAVG
jgi:hypothetical protein